MVERRIIRWRLFRLLKQMPFSIVIDPNSLPRVMLSEPGGASAEVLLYGGQVVSWKNEHGEELLFVSSKTSGKSPAAIRGGISICFPRVSNLGPSEQHEYSRFNMWSLDCGQANHCTYKNQSSVDLILKPSEKDLKMWPCRFELRLRILLSPGRLILVPSVTNVGDKSFSFTFALRNYLSVSDISEVRVEGLETLDYLDNLLQKQRLTEQADALTFDDEVNRVYLSTPNKIAIIDHQKKRTFVLQKERLPDTAVWNPWNKSSKALPCFGDGDYKTMLSVDSSVIEKPVILKPGEVWRGCQEISTVSSSYCSGQLDPRTILLYIN